MINIAVIGIGQWGKNHVRVLKESPDFDLKVIVDIETANLEKFHQIYQIEMSKKYDIRIDIKGSQQRMKRSVRRMIGTF